MSDAPNFSKISRRKQRMILMPIEAQVCQGKLCTIYFLEDSKDKRDLPLLRNDFHHKEAHKTNNQTNTYNDLFSARSMPYKAITAYLTTKEVIHHCGNRKKACWANSKETRYIMNSTVIINFLVLEVKMHNRNRNFNRRWRITSTTLGRQLQTRRSHYRTVNRYLILLVNWLRIMKTQWVLQYNIPGLPFSQITIVRVWAKLVITCHQKPVKRSLRQREPIGRIGAYRPTTSKGLTLINASSLPFLLPQEPRFRILSRHKTSSLQIYSIPICWETRRRSQQLETGRLERKSNGFTLISN